MKPEKISWKLFFISIMILALIVAIILILIVIGSLHTLTLEEALPILFGSMTLGVLMFGVPYGLYLFTVAFPEKLFKSSHDWFNQPHTHKRRAETLNVDFVNDSVHYTVSRFGEKKSFNFLSRRKRARFMIDARYITLDNMSFKRRDIQWLGLDENSNSVQLDVNIDAWWYQINIDPGYGGDAFVKALRRSVSQKLRQNEYTHRFEVRSDTGADAYITSQNLQGIFEKYEAVELHVTPLWMVVLHNGRVIQQHFIDDIADIRATKHPTDLDDAMQLLTFEVGEEAFAYALKDKSFVTRLSDATRDGIDSQMMRKKKANK